MTATTTGTLRQLGNGDGAALLALCDRDPITHCFVRSRVESAGLDQWRLGAQVWGWYEGAELVSALYHGANVVPVECTTAATAAFASRARDLGRRCSSIVGPANDVLALWTHLQSAWGPAREIRTNQLLMAIDEPPHVVPDPAVRLAVAADFDVLHPACVAMFTEEVGISPIAGGGASAYRGRITELIERGRAFARIQDDQVVFKAELGVASSHATQIQGVWVPPERRGTGLSASGIAAIVDHALRLAPITSLYVNDYNVAARRAYERVGFKRVGTFATVLFG